MSERIYSLLLRLYPRQFRDEYAGEMQQLFRDRLAAEQGIARLGLWLDVLADLARSIPSEHFRSPAPGIYRVSPWIHFRALFVIFLLTELAFVLASFTGPLSRISPFIEGLFLILLLGSPFPLINALKRKRKPIEYTLDPDGIRFGKAHIRPVEIARIVEQPGQALFVFGTNGAQIPVPTQISGYQTLRTQLAAWSPTPIDVLPKRRIPGSALYVAWVTVIVSTNPILVSLGAVTLAVIALLYTLHPSPRAQYPPDSTVSRWGNFLAAATVLTFKVFLSRL
jgi:hypothetical protein